MPRSILSQLLRTIDQTPHRDVTLLPYGAWFSMYVVALQTFRRRLVSQRLPEATDELLRLAHAKQLLNSAMLSSVFAQLSDAYGASSATSIEAVDRAKDRHSDRDNSSRAAHSVGPERENALYRSADISPHSASTHAVPNPSQPGATHSMCAIPLLGPRDLCELVSPCFLTDSIRGGRCVEICSAALRQQTARHSHRSSPSTHHTTDSGAMNESEPGHRGRDMHLIIPFTTLCQIKHEAHVRAQSTSSSLQERRARQVLLQSIMHVIHLQGSVTHEQRNFTEQRPSAHPMSLPTLHVSLLLPTDEMDALCQMHSFNAAWKRSTTAASAAKALGAPDHDSRTEFTLQALCDNWLTRLVYLTVYYATRLHPSQRITPNTAAARRREETSDLYAHTDVKDSHRTKACQLPCGSDGSAKTQTLSEADGLPVRLVVGAENLHSLRSQKAEDSGGASSVPSAGLGLLCSTEKSRILNILTDANMSCRYLASAAGLPEDEMSHLSTHAQAVKRCGAMVRRMTTREENMRFVLQQK